MEPGLLYSTIIVSAVLLVLDNEQTYVGCYGGSERTEHMGGYVKYSAFARKGNYFPARRILPLWDELRCIPREVLAHSRSQYVPTGHVYRILTVV